MKKLISVLLFVIFIGVGFLAHEAFAADIHLGWDANDPAPDGYRIFQREEGGVYDNYAPVWEGSGTIASITLPDTDVDKKYYWVVRAYDNDLEGANSQEIGVTLKPDGSYVFPAEPQGFEAQYIIYNNGGIIYLNK